MKLSKATQRDRKQSRKDRMVVGSKSVFVISEEQKKRHDAVIKKKREEKLKEMEQ